jgi:hypothetical protein
VPNTNKEDGELGGNRKLWDVGVVVKDDVAFDEFHKAIKYRW